MRTRCSYKCLLVAMADPSGFATRRGFRFNKAYETVVSALSSCVFLLGSREKGTAAKAVRVLKHWPGMVTAHQWELSKLGGEILEF